MAQETIRVGTINAVSPTLRETLRQCKLSAGLSRAVGSSHHVLGNPKAWLGTAYHAVLERIDPEHRDDIESIVRHLWGATIEAQYEEVARSSLQRSARLARDVANDGSH